MKWPNSIKFVEVLGTMAQTATVLSLFVIFAQLRTEAEERKVERSLSFIQRFNDDPLEGGRTSLILPWKIYQPELRRINQQGITADSEKRLVLDVLIEYEKTNASKKPIESIHEIAEFFDTLDACIEANACDAVVAQKILGRYARSFNCTYGFIVQDQAASFGSPELGVGLKNFAGRFKC